MTVRALRSTAHRIQQLAAEAAELRAELDRLVAAVAPWLLELPGIGPISAAKILVSWGQPDSGLIGAGDQAPAQPLR